jgi:hypothetical protein
MVEHGDVSSPPVDFSVYGLDASWPGQRWFEYYQSRNGDHAWAVGLGHRSADGSGGVIVSALRRTHYDVTSQHGEVDPLVEIAFDGAVRLGNATLPEVDGPGPRGLLTALVDHMQYQSEHYRDWPVAKWQVDGNLITEPVLNFADGWMTFTDAVPDVYLIVLGLDIRLSSSLNVTRVSDLRAYGFNSKARLSPSLLAEARERTANAELPPRRFLHPDLLALVT